MIFWSTVYAVTAYLVGAFVSYFLSYYLERKSKISEEESRNIAKAVAVFWPVAWPIGLIIMVMSAGEAFIEKKLHQEQKND